MRGRAGTRGAGWGSGGVRPSPHVVSTCAPPAAAPHPFQSAGVQGDAVAAGDAYRHLDHTQSGPSLFVTNVSGHTPALRCAATHHHTESHLYESHLAFRRARDVAREPRYTLYGTCLTRFYILIES